MQALAGEVDGKYRLIADDTYVHAHARARGIDIGRSPRWARSWSTIASLTLSAP